MRTIKQYFRAVRRRLIRRDDVIIVRCLKPEPRPPALGDLVFVRMNQRLGYDLPLVMTTMHAAGEAGVDAAARFCRGDEFFALRGAQGIVTFKWVTYAERKEGSVRILPEPDRAVIYNSVTMENHRGRGLSTDLMRHIQMQLVREGRTDFAAGIHRRNTSSLKANRKGSFSHVAMASELIILHRFRLALPLTLYDQNARVLFQRPQAPIDVRWQPSGEVHMRGRVTAVSSSAGHRRPA